MLFCIKYASFLPEPPEREYSIILYISQAFVNTTNEICFLEDDFVAIGCLEKKHLFLKDTSVL